MDYFSVQATKKERWFTRKWKTKSVFTCTGKENEIVEISSSAIFVKTETGKEPFKISRVRLRQAMREFLYRRTISRADVGAFSKYNSAVMAILIAIFSDVAIVKKTIRYGYRLIMRGIRWFPAGTERAVRDLEIAVANGVRFVLLSYYHLREDTKERWKYHIRRLGLKVLLDSGEFSRYRSTIQGKVPKEIDVHEYGTFVIKHQDVLFGYFNLDVVGDPEQSRKNSELLRAICNMAPIPIWHCQSSFESMDEIVREEHPVIAVGGSVFLSEKKRREVFDELFRRYEGVAFHWLGGSSSLLHLYPWFSVDSSSWLAGRKYRRLITPGGQVKAQDSWTGQECLAYNVRFLTSLDNPLGVQFGIVI